MSVKDNFYVRGSELVLCHYQADKNRSGMNSLHITRKPGRPPRVAVEGTIQKDPDVKRNTSSKLVSSSPGDVKRKMDRPDKVAKGNGNIGSPIQGQSFTLSTSMYAYSNKLTFETVPISFSHCDVKAWY